MAINRLKIAQPTGDPKTVAFTDDILLNGLTGNGLITVTGSGQEKTVSTDASKLTLDDGNVKVVTPLVLDVKTEAPSTTTNALYSVKDGTVNKLYWNGKLIDAHDPGTGYVTESEFDSTIGTWSTSSDKTVKAAIEENKAAIADDLSGITAGTSGEGVTVTIGAKSNKSQTVAVSVQDGTTSQKGIVQLANAHDKDDVTKAATGTTVASAIGTETTRATGVEDAIKRDIGSWSSGSTYENSTVKAAIENISSITGFKVVSVLPETGEKNTIYLVKPEGAASYEEWIYVEVSAGTKQWEKIGDTDIKLTDYYKKTEIGTGFDTTNTVKKYIEDQDTAVKDTADTASATSTDNHVTVNLTGTVGNHGLTVSTSDIASADDLTALTRRVDAAESDIDHETTRANAAEVALANRATALETKVGTANLNTTAKDLSGAVNELKSAVDADTTAIGTLASLTTEAKGNLVAAINEVDTNADAAKAAADAAQADADTAQATAEARLASIAGDDGGGVTVSFTTDESKAVTTEVSVAESTLVTNSKFATTDKNVATGAKVQAAIDAAEQRAKDAREYTADNVTIQVANNRFSAKTAAVAQDGNALTTGGQVFSAINSAKSALTGSASVTGTDITIKGAMHEAEAAQTTANSNSSKIGTLNDLSTSAKGNLVAAINEVDTNADAARTAAASAQSTADNAQNTANNAVQTAGGDANINASKSGSNLTVGVKTGSNLAALLSHLSIELEQ